MNGLRQLCRDYGSIILLCFLSVHSIAQDDEWVDTKKHASVSADEWQKGYVVLNTGADTSYNHLKKRGTDTAFGYLNIKMSGYDDVKKLMFRANKNIKKGTLKFGDFFINKSTARYFGFGKKRYQYIYYIDKAFPTKVFERENCLDGWCEVIEEGAITLSKGFYTTYGSSIGTMSPMGGGGGAMMIGGAQRESIQPVYSLKKRDKPPILVGDKTIALLRDDNYMGYEITDRNKFYLFSCIADDKELAEKVRLKKVVFGDIEKIVAEYNSWAQNNTH